jgi:TM2 domain-containing membrane protein YozV
MLEEYLIMSDLNDHQKILFQSQFNNERKNASTAVLLCFFLGGFGAHKFYMGRTGIGLLYLLFSWTLVPALFSLIECFLVSAQVREFNSKKALEIGMLMKTLNKRHTKTNTTSENVA